VIVDFATLANSLSPLQVLPRQTCNIYTTTNYFRDFDGGKPMLDQTVEGGEIFETILRNPVRFLK
jgi:hypothetical protein